jgi:hypothetical protein
MQYKVGVDDRCPADEDRRIREDHQYDGSQSISKNVENRLILSVSKMSMYGKKFKIENKKIFMSVYLYWTADGQICCLEVAYSACDLAMRLEVGVVTYRGWSMVMLLRRLVITTAVSSFCKCA